MSRCRHLNGATQEGAIAINGSSATAAGSRGALLLRFVLCWGLLSLAACAAHMTNATADRASTNRAEERALDQDALRALLSDAYAASPRVEGLMVFHPRGQIFKSNGIYFDVRGRMRVEGTFYIDGPSVCVEGAGIVKRCRRVVPRGNGTYLFIDERAVLRRC